MKPSLRRAILAVVAVVAVVAGFVVLRKVYLERDDIKAAGTPIRLVLGWHQHSPQFAGIYVAEERGYFREVGLDVEVVVPGNPKEPYDLVLGGKAEFGIFPADQLVKRRDGLTDTSPAKVPVAVGTIFGSSVSCFVSLEERGVNTPYDLAGKRVAIYKGRSSDLLLRGLLSMHQIPLDGVTILSAGNSGLEALQKGEFDVLGANVHNEPLVLKERGFHAKVMRLDKFNVRAYSDTVFVRKEYLGSNREVVRRVLRALRRGWRFAADNPSEALNDMYKATDLPPAQSDGARMKAVIAELPSDRGGLLRMDRTRWSDMAHWLKEIGEISDVELVDDLVDYKLIDELE